MKWRYRNLQFKAIASEDMGSRIADKDLEKLNGLLTDGWEIHHSVTIQGGNGATSHILFILRMEVKA